MLPANEGQLITQLQIMDLDDVASEYKDLLQNSQNVKEEIPLIQTVIDKPNNKFSSLLLECSGQHRINEYQKRIITKEDISQIPEDSSIDRIKTVLGYDKSLFLIPKLTDKFIKTGTTNVNTKIFAFFLDQFSKVQNAILDIIKIDPFITTTITEDVLKQFIEQQIPKSHSLKVLVSRNQWFQEYYIEYIIRVFEFNFGSFCNPENMDAHKLFSSRLFSDFVNIDKLIGCHQNIFTVSEATAVYNIYADNMDKDADGLKSKQYMKNMGKSVFTNAFLDRLFDVLPTTEGKIDFVVFVNFYIAYQNMGTKEGINYFFKIIDIDEDGYLTKRDLLFFYKAMIEETKYEDINEDRFFSELVDTVSGDYNKGITRQNLYKLGSSTFFKKLIDINCFKEWECFE